MSSKRFVIACGGTGGHLFPGIAVAETLQTLGHEVLILISEKKIDSLAIEGYDHLKFERVQSIAMPRVTSPKMIPFGIKFLKSLVRCRSIVSNFKADAVLGMGGFTSAAPLIAGRLKGAKTFIHESNAIPGRANKLNAKFANIVLVGFAECAKYFGDRNVHHVGTPLRPALAQKPTREEALSFFDLRPDRKTLLVMGGSQGAHRVNELTCEALQHLPEEEIQVLLLTGPDDFPMADEAFGNAAVGGAVRPFCAEMQYAYAAADIIVCRSGASSLTEIAHYALPAVMVPYPFAADDHQTRNAEIFSKPGAGVLWTQDELPDGKTYAERLINLLQDDRQLEKMSIEMKKIAGEKDASERVCEAMLESIGGA